MTVTCSPCEIALGIGWAIGACTWVIVYYALRVFAAREPKR